MTVIDIDDNLRLLGTAHISKTSADAARREVEEYEPDIVAIELCKSRLEALTRPERFDNETLGKVLREAQKEVALVDRDIQTTLRRAWRRMRFREKWRVMSAILFQEEEEEEIQVDELLENTDLITELMGELRDVAPAAGEVLIDERDEYLAGSIQRLRPEGKILAVIGAGHLEGVAAHLNRNMEVDKERLRELNHIEPPHRAWKGVKWGIPVLMLGLFAWMASQGDVAALKEAAITWLALNAVLAALGAAIARGHPLSILTAATAFANLGSTAGAWIAGSAIIGSLL